MLKKGVVFLLIIAAVFAALLGLVLIIAIPSSATSQTFTPQSGSFSIKAGTKANDGFNASEVASQNCAAGTCSASNSWNLGINSNVPTDVYTQVSLSYDLSSLGITGSQITSLTFNLGGCWHGGGARSCNDAKNPGFNSTGGKAFIYILHGTTYEQIGTIVNLGNSTSSTADNYQTYLRSKSSGFVDDYLNSGILKIKIITVGKTTGSLDVLQVIDFATVGINYDSVSPTPTPNISPTPSPTPIPGIRPNIIVIETDDQRWDTIDFMPTIKNRLVDEGITFTNSFVTTSLCCPSRSSFLTGLYVHNHGVWSNNPPGGGVEKFNDSSTVATWIKGAGYTTGFIGKYLNGYGQRVDPFIPPGWSDWHGLLSGYWGRFYDNGVVNNDGGYSTDVISDKAVTFIRNAKEPFFLWLTPYAPHSVSNYPLPPVVAPRHVGTCEDLPSYRPPSFNEADVADKPAFVRNTSLLDPAAIAKLDTFRKDQICSLKAVDEAVAAILDALGTKLDNTVVVFTSDNGFLWGGHRLTAKNRVYEESIRVPLVIRYPKLIPTATVNDKLVLNIDLAPTIAQLAGVAPASLVNGQSLVPLLSNPSADWRSDFLIEHVGGNFAVRNKQYKYVELGTGEKELYDLTVDPYELTSQHNNPAYASIINTLHTRLLELKAE